jgi:hypothetical protein
VLSGFRRRAQLRKRIRPSDSRRVALPRIPGITKCL